MTHTATITVKYAYPPDEGKKMGKVTTQDGDKYLVWADKVALYQPGGVYTVEYTESEFKGSTFKTIKNMKPQGSDPQMPSRAPQKPTGGVSGISASGDAKSEDMACMSCCGRYLGGLGQGGIEFPSAEELERMFRNTRLAWRKSLKEPEAPKIDYKGELDDEIPGF